MLIASVLFFEIYDDAINECANYQLEYYFSPCNSRQLCNESRHPNCHLARYTLEWPKHANYL